MKTKNKKTTVQKHSSKYIVPILSSAVAILSCLLILAFLNMKDPTEKQKLAFYPFLLYKYIDAYCDEFSKEDNETYYCLLDDYGEKNDDTIFISFIYSHVDKATSIVSENLQSATIYFNKTGTEKTGITGWKVQDYAEKIEKNGPTKLREDSVKN